jgi:hypothetical protein
MRRYVVRTPENLDQQLKLFRQAYRRAIIVEHPDKMGQNNKDQQLNLFKEFLCDFKLHDTQIRCRTAGLRVEWNKPSGKDQVEKGTLKLV